MRPEPPALEQLAFEGREEAFAHRIVVAIPDRSGGGAHAGVPASLAGDVLRSLVAMVDHAVGPTLPERHVEGIEHELCAQVAAMDQPVGG